MATGVPAENGEVPIVTWEEFEKNAIDHARILEAFPLITQLARKELLTVSSVGSSGLDIDQIYLKPLLASYVEVYHKIYIRYGDLAKAHVQNDVNMTKNILLRSLKSKHYAQNWLNIFIDENAERIMTKWENQVDMFTFTFTSFSQENTQRNEFDDFMVSQLNEQSLQEALNDIYNVMDVDPSVRDQQLVDIAERHDSAKSAAHVAFIGVRHYLTEQYPNLKMNPTQIMQPLTKATLPDNDDVFVGGGQFLKKRVAEAIEIAERGAGIELVAEKLFHTFFKNFFLGNNITFYDVHNCPGVNLLAIYRLSKYIMTPNLPCSLDEINFHLLNYMGFPTRDEQERIDAHLKQKGIEMQQQPPSLPPTYFNLDGGNRTTETSNAGFQVSLGFEANSDQVQFHNNISDNSSGFSSINGSVRNLSLTSEASHSQPIPRFINIVPIQSFQYISEDLIKTAYGEYIRTGGCGPGSVKAGIKLFKGIMSPEEQTYKLKSPELFGAKLEIYNAKKQEMLNLLKFWEIQENFELKWDRFRQDYLCSKIIVDKSNQLRQKNNPTKKKKKAKKTLNVGMQTKDTA